MYYRYNRALYSLDNIRKVQISRNNMEITIDYLDGGVSYISLGGSEQEAITVLNDIEKKLNGR